MRLLSTLQIFVWVLDLQDGGCGGSGTLTFYVRQSATGGIQAELGSRFVALENISALM